MMLQTCLSEWMGSRGKTRATRGGTANADIICDCGLRRRPTQDDHFPKQLLLQYLSIYTRGGWLEEVSILLTLLGTYSVIIFIIIRGEARGEELWGSDAYYLNHRSRERDYQMYE